jgi:hypothetical protein
MVEHSARSDRNNGFLIISQQKGHMSGPLSSLTGLVVKAGLALFLANEVRGFVLAAPVLYGMYEAGGTIMAVWLGICSLAGIALTVVGPLLVARKLRLV